MGGDSSSYAAAVLKSDVFISYRGEDVRKVFASHLYDALVRKHINTYIDEVSIEKGDDFDRVLPKAIEEAAISIIIFSKNYASSRWCLNELLHILKCKKEKARIVLLIFYGIDRSHIEKIYAAAFEKHEKSFKLEKVREWRRAVTEAAGLLGWESLKCKSDAVLVREVVEDVTRKLESTSSTRFDDQKGLVEIHGHFCKIESLLRSDSPNVLILVIWGKAGTRKTTLARVVYQHFYNQFEGTCFLPSVREEAQRRGLDALEKKVFSKLLGEKDPDVYNSFVSVKLSRTKALLVLDDVDNFYHFKRLAGDRDRFGPGSKIIVTSRDLQVLNQLIAERYEVQALDLNDASAKVVSFAGGKKKGTPRLPSRI